MELLFLGTGAGVPSRQRNVSSLALKLLNEINETWLFDCGEATQHQILKTTLKPRKISKIFITHLHGDHIFGLPGFLSSRSFQGGTEPVTIYGPKGIEAFIKMALKISKSHLTYPVHIVELDVNGGEFKFKNGWEVEYLPLNHGILSFGFRIKEPNSPGELRVDLLKNYNIPNGPMFGRLKRKETVTLEDGTVLNGADFIGEETPGRIVSIIGDTRPNKNIPKLVANATVMVHEGTHGGEEAKMANQYFHSTNKQAAQYARDAKVGHLYLNHISARYVGKESKELEKEAARVFTNVTVVNDLDEYKIPN